MAIEITEYPAADELGLARYGAIPISFMVTSRLVLRPIENGLDGLLLVEEPAATPYIKDYDAIEGKGPIHWGDCFDLLRWGILAAFESYHRVGGAVAAWNTPGADMLEGRSGRVRAPACRTRCSCSGAKNWNRQNIFAAI